MAETNMGVAQVSVEMPVPVGIELPLVVVLFGVALIAFVLARSDKLGRRYKIYGVAGMYGGVLIGLILLAIEVPLVIMLFGVALITIVLVRSDKLGRRYKMYEVVGMYGGVLFGSILLAYSLTKFGLVTLLLGYDEVYLRGLPAVGLTLLSVMLLLYALSETEGTPLKVHR